MFGGGSTQQQVPKHEKYRKMESVGKGMFGSVNKAVRIEDGQVVAMKEMAISKFKMKPRLLEMLKSEIVTLRETKHRNLVQLIDNYHTNSHQVLVYEFCEGGTMKQFLRSTKDFNEGLILSYILQVLYAVQCLHAKNIIHRDIKPDNILFKTGQRRQIKVADLGFCTNKGMHYDSSIIGSPGFLAPEVFLQKLYSPKSDIYAVGVMVYEIIFKKLPFTQKNQHELAAYKARWFPKKEDMPDNCSKFVYKVMAHMVHPNHEKRAGAEKLINAIQKELQQKHPEYYKEARGKGQAVHEGAVQLPGQATGPLINSMAAGLQQQYQYQQQSQQQQQQQQQQRVGFMRSNSRSRNQPSQLQNTGVPPQSKNLQQRTGRSPNTNTIQLQNSNTFFMPANYQQPFMQQQQFQQFQQQQQQFQQNGRQPPKHPGHRSFIQGGHKHPQYGQMAQQHQQYREKGPYANVAQYQKGSVSQQNLPGAQPGQGPRGGPQGRPQSTMSNNQTPQRRVMFNSHQKQNNMGARQPSMQTGAFNTGIRSSSHNRNPGEQGQGAFNNVNVNNGAEQQIKGLHDSKSTQDGNSSGRGYQKVGADIKKYSGAPQGNIGNSSRNTASRNLMKDLQSHERSKMEIQMPNPNDFNESVQVQAPLAFPTTSNRNNYLGGFAKQRGQKRQDFVTITGGKPLQNRDVEQSSNRVQASGRGQNRQDSSGTPPPQKENKERSQKRLKTKSRTRHHYNPYNNDKHSLGPIKKPRKQQKQSKGFKGSPNPTMTGRHLMANNRKQFHKANTIAIEEHLPVGGQEMGEGWPLDYDQNLGIEIEPEQPNLMNVYSHYNSQIFAESKPMALHPPISSKNIRKRSDNNAGMQVMGSQRSPIFGQFQFGPF